MRPNHPAEPTTKGRGSPSRWAITWTVEADGEADKAEAEAAEVELHPEITERLAHVVVAAIRTRKPR